VRTILGQVRTDASGERAQAVNRVDDDQVVGVYPATALRYWEFANAKGYKSSQNATQKAKGARPSCSRSRDRDSPPTRPSTLGPDPVGGYIFGWGTGRRDPGQTRRPARSADRTARLLQTWFAIGPSR
jgi:hypothetical protein